MSKMKKTIGLLSMAAACLIGGVAFMNTTSVNAASTIPQYGQMEGASIRYRQSGEDENRTGMRFTYRLDKATSGIEEDFSNIQNMGLLIAQTSVLNGATLTVDTAASHTKYYENGQKVETVTGNTINVGNFVDNKFVLDEEGDSYVLMVYLYNIPKEYYNTEFTSVGYVQLDSQSAIQYTGSISRSVSYVAKEAYYNNGYADDSQKSSLENYLNKYTVNFNTGDGTAVDSVTVLDGGKLDATLVSSLDGYTFAGWTKGGTAVDLTTFTVTETCTLDANFKKTVSEEQVVNLGEALSLGTQTVSKITVNGEVLSEELYSVDNLYVTFDASAFTAAGNKTVRVYQSEFVYTEYTVVVVADVVAFSAIDKAYALPVYNGGADNARANFNIASNPYGMEGNFYHLTFDYNAGQYEAGLKVKPTLTKEEIENYYSGYSLVFNYYIDATNAPTVNILYNGAYTPGVDSDGNGAVDSDWGLGKRSAYTETYNQGVWNTAVIPVSDILAYEDEFNNTTGTFTGNKLDETILDRMYALEDWNCTGQLLYFSWANSKGELYAGNFNLVKDVHLIGLEDGSVTPSVKTGETTVAMGKDYVFDPAVMEMDTTGLTLSYYVDGVKNDGTKVALADKEANYQTTLTVMASDANGILQTLYTQTITVVDTSVPLAWNVLPAYDATTGKITSNAIFMHTYNNYGNPGHYPVGGSVDVAYVVDASAVPTTTKTGSFYKISRTSDYMFDGFKLTTNLTKAQLELYGDKYLQFDLYFNITPNVSQNFTLGFMHNGTSFYEEVNYKANNLMGTWQTVQIPVTYIIENYDVFSKMSAATSFAGNIVIMTATVGGASHTVEYYMSTPIIADYDMSVALSWQEVKFAAATAYPIHQTSAGSYYNYPTWHNQGSVVSAADVPEGYTNTGNYYKIALTANNYGENTATGLRVKLNVSQETLTLYKNGYVTFNVYADLSGYTAQQTEGASISYMGLGNNTWLLSSSDATNEWTAINTWHTVRIPVQSILANYDAFASGEWFSSAACGTADNAGAIMVVHIPNGGWDTSKTNIYVSELKIGA